VAHPFAQFAKGWVAFANACLAVACSRRYLFYMHPKKNNHLKVWKAHFLARRAILGEQGPKEGAEKVSLI
jgi:hypothetical protein